MYPVNDIVCNLIQTQFSRWKDYDKRDVLYWGGPLILSIYQEKEKIKRAVNRTESN